MDYHKIAYKAKKFAQRYDNQLEGDELYSIKRELNPDKDESFYTTIKHLYLYQSAICGLPEWYKTLVEFRQKELEAYFLDFAESLIKEACLSEHTDDFINNKLLKHYQDKGNFYLTPIMDNLPLHLRLKLYVHLYHDESDPKLKSYLRHRMASLFARLGHVKTAQQLSIYNWSVATAKATSYFASVDYLNQTLKAHKTYSYETAHWHTNHDASLLAQELCIYYKTVLETANAYNTPNMATLELVALSYSHYRQLAPLTFALKSYLRTQDKATFISQLEEQKRIFIYTYEEKIWTDQELKDQLIIYKELLKFA